MKHVLSKPKQRGQGMTEYIVIVALIAVVAIAVYQLFGATVRNQTAGIAMKVAGKNGSTAIAQAGTAAQKAETDAKKNKALDSYGNQNANGSPSWRACSIPSGKFASSRPRLRTLLRH